MWVWCGPRRHGSQFSPLTPLCCMLQMCRNCMQSMSRRRAPGNDVPRRSSSGRRRRQSLETEVEAKADTPVMHDNHHREGLAIRRTMSNNSAKVGGKARNDQTVVNIGRSSRSGSVGSANSGGSRLGTRRSLQASRRDSLNDDQWRCELCSFKNNMLMPQCEQCNTKRP